MKIFMTVSKGIVPGLGRMPNTIYKGTFYVYYNFESYFLLGYLHMKAVRYLLANLLSLRVQHLTRKFMSLKQTSWNSTISAIKSLNS